MDACRQPRGMAEQPVVARSSPLLPIKWVHAVPLKTGLALEMLPKKHPEWGGGRRAPPSPILTPPPEQSQNTFPGGTSEHSLEEGKSSQTQKLHYYLFYTPDIHATNNLGGKQVQGLKSIEDPGANPSGLHHRAETQSDIHN